jgi:uncharacterized protein YhfF
MHTVIGRNALKQCHFWGRDKDDDSLVRQVLRGEKTVTCSVAVQYYDDPLDEPAMPGDLVEVIDGHGERRCIIRIDRVYELPFGEVTDEIVKGECAGSVEEFKADHHRCWDTDLEKSGLVLDDSTMLVIEHFTLIGAV